MSGPVTLTANDVKRLLSGNADWAEWVEPIQDLFPKYNINTKERIAMFVAQCGHESNNFRVLEENLNYSASGLNRVFPKYFERAGRDANKYHRQPERIANVVYSGRLGNGDEASGDGWRFRGRGVIQLTGKYNVSRFAEYVGMSLDDTVEYLGTKKGALESACWYWNSRNLNEASDARDVLRATRLINGGTNGLSDRKHRYEEAMKILGGDYTPDTSPTLLKLHTVGEEVKELQRKLGLEDDGIFGKITEAAVIAWQANNGLVPDGIVGPQTKKKLFSV